MLVLSAFVLIAIIFILGVIYLAWVDFKETVGAEITRCIEDLQNLEIGGPSKYDNENYWG